MSNLAAWMAKQWQARQMRRDLAGLTTRLRRVEVRLEKRKANLEILRRRIVSLSDALAEDLAVVDVELSSVQKEVAELAKRQQQHVTEVESLRSRVRVAEDVTIPGLVAANKLVLERYDADTAIQVRRQVLTS